MTQYMITHDDTQLSQMMSYSDNAVQRVCRPITENTGAGVKKMTTLANPNNFITKMSLTVQL